MQIFDKMRKKRYLLSALIAMLMVLMTAFAVPAAQTTGAEKADESIGETACEAEPVEAAKLELHMLNVGQALCVFVKVEKEGEEPHCLLYDGGRSETSSYVVAYLKKQGFSELDYVIASHYDEDHISGIIGALNVFDCETVLSPDYEVDSNIYKSYISAVEGKMHRSCIRVREISFRSAMRL